MSTLTNLLNKSTSITTDIVASVVLGSVAGLGADWLQLDAMPFVGAYVPPAVAGAVGMAIYHRQRTNLRKAAPSFG